MRVRDPSISENLKREALQGWQFYVDSFRSTKRNQKTDCNFICTTKRLMSSATLGERYIMDILQMRTNRIKTASAFSQQCKSIEAEHSD